MKWIICLFKGHRPITCYWETAKTFYGNSVCERCGCKLGVPNLTKTYIEENYPMPKIQNNVNTTN